MVFGDPPANASSNENGFVCEAEGSVGVPLAAPPKAESKPDLVVERGDDGAFPFPFTALGAGGKAGAELLAEAKSKLSSNAESKEKFAAGEGSPPPGILPMASSKALSPAT